VETLLKEKENSTNATTVWTKKIAGQTELLLFIAAGPITKLLAGGGEGGEDMSYALLQKRTH
jgi:hypothetical protein